MINIFIASTQIDHSHNSINLFLLSSTNVEAENMKQSVEKKMQIHSLSCPKIFHDSNIADVKVAAPGRMNDKKGVRGKERETE